MDTCAEFRWWLDLNKSADPGRRIPDPDQSVSRWWRRHEDYWRHGALLHLTTSLPHLHHFTRLKPTWNGGIEFVGQYLSYDQLWKRSDGRHIQSGGRLSLALKLSISSCGAKPLNDVAKWWTHNFPSLISKVSLIRLKILKCKRCKITSCRYASILHFFRYEISMQMAENEYRCLCMIHYMDLIWLWKLFGSVL